MGISKNLIGLKKFSAFILLMLLTVSLFVVPSEAAFSTVEVTITPQILAHYFESGYIDFSFEGNWSGYYDLDSWWIDEDNDILWFYLPGDFYFGGPFYEVYLAAAVDFDFNYRYVAGNTFSIYTLGDYWTVGYWNSARVLMENDITNDPETFGFIDASSGSMQWQPSSDYGDGIFSYYFDYAIDPRIFQFNCVGDKSIGSDTNLLNRLYFSILYLGDTGENQVGYGACAIGISSFTINIDAKDNPELSGDSATIVAYLNEVNKTMQDVNDNIEYQNQKIDEIIGSLNTSTPEQDNVVSDFQSGADKYIGDLTSASDFESEVIDGFESFFGDYTDFDEIYGPWPESDVGNVAPPELDNFIGHKVIGVIFSVVAICALLHTLLYGRW